MLRLSRSSTSASVCACGTFGTACVSLVILQTAPKTLPVGTFSGVPHPTIEAEEEDSYAEACLVLE